MTWRPPPAPRRRGPRILIVGGVVMALIGIVLSMCAAFFMLESSNETSQAEGVLNVSVDIPGEASVDLRPGRYRVVALGPGLVQDTYTNDQLSSRQRYPFADPDVTVTEPNGEAVRLEKPPHDYIDVSRELHIVGFTEFTAPKDGRYRLQVRGEAGQVAKVGIDEANSLTEEAKPWLASSVVHTLGGFLATFGVIAAVGGIVWIALSGGSTGRRFPPVDCL